MACTILSLAVHVFISPPGNALLASSHVCLRTPFRAIGKRTRGKEHSNWQRLQMLGSGGSGQHYQPGSKPPLLTRRKLEGRIFKTRSKQALSSLYRVALPTIIATILGFVYFDNISIYIRSTLEIDTIRILMEDEAQFIQNFLTVIGLLFSILAGNAYAALYQQQETIYFALFQEVSEAKSLLEQTTLVCQGRPFYRDALRCIRDYVKNDLRRLDVPPAQLLSTRPMEDPLESIMYMTSVGVPSIVYETVKNLRQARGYRLGAMQRKFPLLGIALLYLLAAVELLAFPLLGAGTANSIGILSLQSFLFACLCGAHMLVLRIIQELWQASGGVFNVDEVLQQIVCGLEDELEMRSARPYQMATRPWSPYSTANPPYDMHGDADNQLQQPDPATRGPMPTEPWYDRNGYFSGVANTEGAASFAGGDAGADAQLGTETSDFSQAQQSSPDAGGERSPLRAAVLSALALGLSLPRNQRVALGRVWRNFLRTLQEIVIVERFEVGLWTKPSFRGLLSQLLATFLMHVKQVPRSKVQVRR